MSPPVRARQTALSFLLLTAPAPVTGQELLTAADVVRLPSPPPEHRISYGADSLQFGHLRLPSTPGPHPVVVFLHGGCWLSQYDIGHAGPLEQVIADSGYAVWSLEYRRAGHLPSLVEQEPKREELRDLA